MGNPIKKALEEERELQKLYPGYQGVDKDYLHAGKRALERWADWKFGLRIHWSLYSITGNGGESWPLRNLSPTFRAQYEELYKWWNPSCFNAEEWCQMMVGAGFKYFTFTTKHHDGFSMFNTKTKVKRRKMHIGLDAGKIIDCNLRYSIMETPFKRDITKELVKAGRKYNLGIGLYFSHIDWFDSDFRIDEWNYQRDKFYARKSDPEGFQRMIKRYREQIREICSNYGKVDLLSFDMHFPEEAGIQEDIIETVKIARRLQPEMLMRRRGIGSYGDYKTPEGVIPDSPGDALKDGNIPWKVIYPGSKHFSHIWNDEHKPVSWIIKSLVDIVSKGGNFQIGYGPGPDGTWGKEVIERLKGVGDWLKVNGEAIYSTRPYRVFKEGEKVRFTRSKDGKYVYVIFLNWPDALFKVDKIRLQSVRPVKGSAIFMLGLDHKFNYSQNEKGLAIDIPEWFQDESKRPCKMGYVFKFKVQD